MCHQQIIAVLEPAFSEVFIDTAVNQRLSETSGGLNVMGFSVCDTAVLRQCD